MMLVTRSLEIDKFNIFDLDVLVVKHFFLTQK